LGDISVFIFFGLVAVFGTFYLHTHQFSYVILLPATSCGLFATAVLNINNIRDIESDAKAGKKSIPVRVGRSNAVIYHHFLVLGGLCCAVFYTFWQFQGYWQTLFCLTLPLFWINLQAIRQKTSAQEIDPYLKQMALSTLLFVILFGIGHILA
jgi:1,4-dihydroxy-2-naphthoate octaprenyltransferase